jgi:hypothetical protein
VPAMCEKSAKNNVSSHVALHVASCARSLSPWPLPSRRAGSRSAATMHDLLFGARPTSPWTSGCFRRSPRRCASITNSAGEWQAHMCPHARMGSHGADGSARSILQHLGPLVAPSKLLSLVLGRLRCGWFSRLRRHDRKGVFGVFHHNKVDHLLDAFRLFWCCLARWVQHSGEGRAIAHVARAAHVEEEMSQRMAHTCARMRPPPATHLLTQAPEHIFVFGELSELGQDAADCRARLAPRQSGQRCGARSNVVTCAHQPSRMNAQVFRNGQVLRATPPSPRARDRDRLH